MNMRSNNKEYECSYFGSEDLLSFWLGEFPELDGFVKDRHFSSCDIENAECNTIVLPSSEQQNPTLPFKRLLSLSQYLELLLANSLILPNKLRIDFSTLCQLNCRDCYMREANYGTMGRGYLKLENFKRLIEDNPQIKEIEASNSGELFLNPDLVDIIKHAHERRVRLTAYNGVNFNTVSDAQLRALVKYKFGGLTLSIDGACNETYANYRRGGDFSTVIENVKKLLAYKKKYNSIYPVLRWQYIIMDNNEEDIPYAKKLASELGIPIEFKLTWNKSYKPKNIELLKRETGLSSFERGSHENGAPYFGHLKCIQMFLSPQINWDGRLLGCCNLYKEDYGVNVFDVGLRAALCNPRYIAAKKYLLFGEATEGIDLPCLRCSTNRKMRLSQTELQIIKNSYGEEYMPKRIDYIPYS